VLLTAQAGPQLNAIGQLKRYEPCDFAPVIALKTNPASHDVEKHGSVQREKDTRKRRPSALQKRHGTSLLA